MGGRGASSENTLLNKFKKMSAKEAFREYYKLENHYYNDILNTIGREATRNILRGSLNKNHSNLKPEEIGKTYIALQTKIKDTIKQQKKEKAAREKSQKERAEFVKKYGRDAVKAKYSGYDINGKRIKVGDAIRRANNGFGWEKIK